MEKHYYGFDLPSVIDVMKPACNKVMSEEQKKFVSFASVDATNYDSLRSALGENKEPICIVTEGLFGYFSESELVSMCQAIHKLLSEFGGCWVTADAGILEIYTITYGALTGNDTSAFAAQMKNFASSMADVEFYKNSLFTKGQDGAIEFLKKQGFSVKAESVSRYLKGLRTVDEETERALCEKYSGMSIWTPTVDKAPEHNEKPVDPNLPFKVQGEVNDGVFSVSIQGRMDTLTAPELLKCFQEAGEGIREIHVDVSRMAYVSSAGLRVLLMMYKSLDDKSGFHMAGVNDAVREILETTGFDQFLL